MFAVEVYAAVWRFVFVDGRSRREAARVIGMSRQKMLKFCRLSLPPRSSYFLTTIAMIATSMKTMRVPIAVKIDGFMLNVAFVCSATRPSSCGQV